MEDEFEYRSDAHGVFARKKRCETVGEALESFAGFVSGGEFARKVASVFSMPANHGTKVVMTVEVERDSHFRDKFTCTSEVRLHTPMGRKIELFGLDSDFTI